MRIPVGTDMCHCGCAYTVFKTVQRPGVHSAVYRAVHYIEPFKIKVGHSPGFVLPSVAILPLCCKKRRNVIFTHSPQEIYIIINRTTCGWILHQSRIRKVPYQICSVSSIFVLFLSQYFLMEHHFSHPDVTYVYVEK